MIRKIQELCIDSKSVKLFKSFTGGKQFEL